jgi:hypothetical protein
MLEDPDRDGMYLEKKPWFLKPSAMSLVWELETMSKPAKRVVERAITLPAPSGMLSHQEYIGTLCNKLV